MKIFFDTAGIYGISYYRPVRNDNAVSKCSFKSESMTSNAKTENNGNFFLLRFLKKLLPDIFRTPKKGKEPEKQAAFMCSIADEAAILDDTEGTSTKPNSDVKPNPPINNFKSKPSLSSYYQDFDYLIEHSSTGDVRSYHHGRLKYEKRADGTVRTFSFDGKLVSEELPNGLKRTYYPNGAIESEIFPNGCKNSYYNNGKLKEEIAANGESYTYDMNGFITQYSNGKGKVNSFKYDAKGRLQSKVSTTGISRKYFASGKDLYEIDSRGNIKRYSPSGKLLYEKSRNGTIKVKTKGLKGDKPITILPDGKVVESKFTRQWNNAYKSFMSAISEAAVFKSDNKKQKDNELKSMTKDIYEQMLNGDFEKIKDKNIKQSITKWIEAHPKYNKALFDLLHC